MVTTSYARQKDALETYFDRTAAAAWTALTGTEKVSPIRQTVRVGRARMRAHLLDLLGADLSGQRLLDAGCGPGALAIEAARRGAEVTGVDIAGNLVALAQERFGKEANRVDFKVGDMTDPNLGNFDHVVAMDSLIHYRLEDVVAALAAFAPRIERSLIFTIAPRTPLLATMHAIGGAFPRADRAPAIQPIALAALDRAMAAAPALRGFQRGRDLRVQSGFYTSHAVEWVRR